MLKITARETSHAAAFLILGVLLGTAAATEPPADGIPPADRPGTGLYAPYQRPPLMWPPRVAPSAAPAALLHPTHPEAR